MDKNFMIKFNFITNMILMFVLVFGSVAYSDGNGIFVNSTDIIPGTFGLDEEGEDFIFPNDLEIENDLIVNGNLIVKGTITAKAFYYEN